MIDYDTPDEDPVIAEVRRAREAYAARFNFDLAALFEDAKKVEASSGRQYIKPGEIAAEISKSSSKETAA